MHQEERDRFDYERTLNLFQQLTDIRFKLLALVPSAAGLGVAFAGSGGVDKPQQLALGLVGFIATVGIVIYELRNTHFYNECIGRAKFLEGELKLSRAQGDAYGGFFRSRTPNESKLLGLIGIRHDRGLALVYSSSLGVWAFIAAEAFFVPQVAGLIAALVVVASFIDFERHDGRFAPYVARYGIGRPRDDVYAFVIEGVRPGAPRWETEVLRLTGAPERPLAKGQQTPVERLDDGKRYVGHLEFLGSKPERYIATWRQVDDGRALLITFAVKTHGNGSVLVMTVDVDRPAVLRLLPGARRVLKKIEADEHLSKVAAFCEANRQTERIDA